MRLLLISSVAAAVAALALAAPAGAVSYNFDFDFAVGAGSGPGQVSDPQGVAVDPPDGEVFVADTGNDRVQVFSASGAPERRWGSRGAGPGQLSAPAGIAVSPEAPNDVYVADTDNHRVERFTQTGELVSELGAGRLDAPVAVAFDAAGNAYVADAGVDRRVVVFGPDGTFLRAMGAGLFSSIAGLTTSADSVFATDRAAGLVQNFGTDGTHQDSFGIGRFRAPTGIASDAAGSLYVADSGNHRIAVSDRSGAPVASFGHGGGGEDSLATPAGVAWSPVNRDLYVVDAAPCCTRIMAWKPIPDPRLGHAMDIQTDKGSVLFKQPGATGFTRLTQVTRVPSGTIIDARRGTVGITSVTPSRQLQSSDFYLGLFQATQGGSAGGLTDAKLVGGDFSHCPAGLRAAKNPQTIRRLWGSGSGRFRTKGRFAAAAIRGTTWLTDDRCDGTLIRVTQGAVTVRDLVAKRTVVVRAGKQYFARGRR